ncbi:hypothetical protein [Gluconobacter aidae]|uniref:hypothetical protein n=1 Tax=Gluconobacter aidae TaxID=2662454 RepID=UPI001297E15E|nr:hypothetical protein [Gluconobacter aidae]
MNAMTAARAILVEEADCPAVLAPERFGCRLRPLHRVLQLWRHAWSVILLVVPMFVSLV